MTLALMGTVVSAAGVSPASGAATPRPHQSAAASAWSLTSTATGWELRWKGSQPLPVGAERLTVRTGDTVLGTAREDGSDAVMDLSASAVPLAATLAGSLDRLQLWRGDERIDQVGLRRPSTSRPDRFTAEPAPAAPSAGTVDPGTPGPYSSERISYDLPGLTLPEYPAPVEVLGEVTAPIGAPAHAPLVIILHGRHTTCYQGGPEGSASGGWPCPEGWQPIPSYAGYHSTADLLASYGNVVVSISANGINGQDFASSDGGAHARSELVRHHLRLWADWNDNGTDPWGGRMHNAVDLDRVVLIGHSRGGEGVARSAVDSRAGDPWRIRGLVLIGPTAFGAQVPGNVATLTILPYCDGDVFDLQGQTYVDGGRDVLGYDPALRSSLLVRGANHNFFNSEWTPGTAAAPSMDDWEYGGNPYDYTCGSKGPNRLSAKSQQRVGATYSAALVRLALGRDAAMRSYLDGTVGAPASADHAEVRVSALGSGRLVLHRAQAKRIPTTTGGVAAEFCLGWVPRFGTTCSSSASQRHGATPHWVGTPSLNADHLQWKRSGTVRYDLERPVDLRDRVFVDLRIALGGETPRTNVGLQVIDADGHAAVLRGSQRAMYALPGTPDFSKLWARTLRGDLRGVKGVDLSRVSAIELSLSGSGEAFVFEASATRRSLPTVQPRFVPAADVETKTVDEGGPGVHTATVAITLDQSPRWPVSYWLTSSDSFTGFRTITFVPGGPTSIEVPVEYTGDDSPGFGQTVSVIIYAKSGGLTGNYVGGLVVNEDDLPPTVHVVNTTPVAAEGSNVTITFSIDTPVDYDIWLNAAFVAPETSTPEIDSDDVPVSTWQSWTFSDPPSPPVTMSQAFIYLFASIPAGSTSVSMEFPLQADGVSEGTESYALETYALGNFLTRLTGTVTD